MPENPAIVDQESISDLAELGAGRVVVDGHRLVTRIAAGGNQGTVHHPHQGPMERRVGEKSSHCREPGCDVIGQRRAGPAPEQHNRRVGAEKGRSGRFIDLGVA